MFEKLLLSDELLHNGDFVDNEVQYNLIHRILEDEEAICLTSTDRKLIYTQSKGQRGWLWISSKATYDERESLISDLVHHMTDQFLINPLPGVCGDPDVAKQFATIYASRFNLQHKTSMIMESYYCPIVKVPNHITGSIQKATSNDIELVAQFMAGFSEDAYGFKVEPESQKAAAQSLIYANQLSLWVVDEIPVSMANIAHRSGRHARINAVYTANNYRKSGYASALVAQQCVMLHKEGLLPMLYANVENPDSNKVYKNIGFVEAGKIAELSFN